MYLFFFSKENLLQNSVDDSWTDSNLNRVSVIQFQEETKGEEEDDEAAAERRVSSHKTVLTCVLIMPLFIPSVAKLYCTIC